MALLYWAILFISIFSGGVDAVTAISDKDMERFLNAGGVELAMAAQPMWFFGQAMNQPPCYPTWAIWGGQQNLGGDTCTWPDAGCNCRNPDKDIGNLGPDFPIYYTYNRCNDDEIRVAYNLFYEKDGFFWAGHVYDWERVIIIWSRGDGAWRQSQLVLSQHSGYDRKEWSDIQNTFDAEDAALPRGGENGRQNLDHPKVYVAWSKHGNFHDRNTGWNDILSQSTGNAFRSQDWWHYHERCSYIRADGSTDVGKQIGEMSWGEANMNPLETHESLCSI